MVFGCSVHYGCLLLFREVGCKLVIVREETKQRGLESGFYSEKKKEDIGTIR